MNKAEKIIDEAMAILKDNPLDAGHDLSHHERVTTLAIEIAEKLNGENIDVDVLKVASMWHDIQVTKGTKLTDYVRERLNKLQFSKEFVDKVTKCIRTHSFDKNPTLPEAQILYDADKLDALSVERGRKVAKSLLNRDMDGARKQLYIRVGKAWIKEMRQKLHSDTAREIYDERVKTILKSKEVDDLAAKLNIDLREIKKSLFKELSIKEKFMIIITKKLYKVRK